MNRKQTRNLTEGNVFSLIMRFFFPMFFTNMLQQLYTIADSAIVGKGLGDDPLAAVGNMGSLSFLIVGFSVGLANGFCVPIAYSFGAKDYSLLRRNTASAIRLSLILTTIMTILSMLFLKDVLLLLQTAPGILKDCLIYGYILFGGLITTVAYNLCSGILRSLGDSTTPFIAIITSTLVNIVLNCLFIFGLKTGVEGAAIATIIAQIISTAICFYKLYKIPELHLHAADFSIDLSLDMKLLKNGIPMALMNSITAVGCMVVQYFVNGLGVAYTTAYSACVKFLNLFMQPACTAGFVMSSFTSQNLGAQKYKRITQGLHVCLGIAAVTYIVLGSVTVFFPGFLAGIMMNGEEPISLAKEYLPACGVMLFTVDFLFIYRSAVQGLGRPLIPMLSGIIEMLMRIFVIVFFLDIFGFMSTAYADIAAWIGALLMNMIAFYIFMANKKPEA